IAALGPGTTNATFALAVVFVPTYGRLARAEALRAKNTDYVLAAEALGARPARVLINHIARNSTAPLIVQASMGVAVAIIAEASLAYLGLGSQPPSPSWGVMLRQSSSFMHSHIFGSFPPG